MPSEALPYTCCFCGCLCDDLEIRVEAGRVVEAVGACERGRPRLIGLATTPGSPSPGRVQGAEAADADAVQAAANLLAKAKAPLIVGLGRAANEAVREAVALADRIGASIEIGDAVSAWPRIVAMQRSGSIGATLGEVRARADLLVFWGCDPATTHPRLLDRGSLVAGDDRRTIVLDSAATETARRADAFLAVDPDRELDVLLTLRALVRETRLDPHRVEATTGSTLAALQDVAESLRGARYGVWFQAASSGRGRDRMAEARRQAVTALIRDLARTSRFVTFELARAGNAHGAEGVLAWQSGFTPGVDFGAGFPESWPGDSSAADRLARRAFDVALVIGGPVPTIPPGKPWIFLGDPEDASFAEATIAVPTGVPGIDDSGTFTRSDGIPLPVRALRTSLTPGAAERLASLRAAVEEAAS